MKYPFSTLPENLTAFCAALRRDFRFKIGPHELIDATRGLEWADISNEREVRDVLRPILSKTWDDVRVFDVAFDRFFYSAGNVLPRAELPGGLETSRREMDEASAATAETRASDSGEGDRDVSAGGFGAGAVREVEEAGAGADARVLRASYSPLEAEGEALVLEPPPHAWILAAAALVRHTRAGASRRWRPAVRGPRFDLRRTLRHSLHTGGEAVVPKWHAHPRRDPRFVVLIDGSRSMGASAQPALQTAIALSATGAKTETFTFSTTLRRITREVRRAAAGERRMLDLRHAWGGGTAIGACLHDFLFLHGERLLGRETVVIIASDGLDVGSPNLLRESMAALSRRSAAIVWINPLLATPGYEPTAVGMSLARPFVTTLARINDPEGLRSLARGLNR